MTKHHSENVKRAKWSLNALRVFAAETYSGDNPDIMHPRRLGNLHTGFNHRPDALLQPTSG